MIYGTNFSELGQEGHETSAGASGVAGGIASVSAVDVDGIHDGATVTNRFVKVPGNGVVERCWCGRGSFRAVKGDVLKGSASLTLLWSPASCSNVQLQRVSLRSWEGALWESLLSIPPSVPGLPALIDLSSTWAMRSRNGR